MDQYSADELQEALRPIGSLISKSEKAQQRLSPGTWQHTMLRDNLKALRIASALMDDGAPSSQFAQDDLEGALAALASMVSRTETALAKLSPGTSQHTLLRNRLKALRVAELEVRAEKDKT